MNRKYFNILVFLWSIIILTLVYTYLFRKYYIIYYHYNIYYVASFIILAIIFVLKIIYNVTVENENKYTKFVALFGSIVGTSLFFAVPLSYYPNIVNNPDVIKILYLSNFIMMKNHAEIHYSVDYLAFPGLSYLLAMSSIIVGMPLKISFVSILYIVFSFMLLFGVLTFGKHSNNVILYLLIVLSSGFIYSFNYFSPQLLGQILFIVALYSLLNNRFSEKSRFIITFVLYLGALIIHPESFIMLFITIVLYFGFVSFIMERSINVVILLRKITIFLIVGLTYIIFYVSSSGPEYIIKQPLMYLANIDIVIKEIILQVFHKDSTLIVTSSLIKPKVIYILDKINILYNIFLMAVVIYISWQLKKEIFKHLILMLSLILSGIVFLIIFASSFGEFVGRIALGISVLISIIISYYFSEKKVKNKKKGRNECSHVFIIFIILLTILVTFPTRVVPHEWNVLAENYYPPINFISTHSTTATYKLYYFLYPNINVSIQSAEYIVLPIGQKNYILGMSKFLGWNAEEVMDKIVRSEKYKGIIYSNELSLILRGGRP